MNVSKDGKTLYFSDNEISNDVEGEKQVFVTKRINGKETHTKKENKKKTRKTRQEQQSLSYDTFSFDNEIVIGVNSSKKTSKKNKKDSQKNSKDGLHAQKNSKEGLHSQKNSKDDLYSQKNSKNKKKKLQKREYNKKNENERHKSKHKKKSHKLLIGIITTIFFIAIIIVISLTTPLFNITEIKVTGNEKISSDTIISLSRFKKRGKYF